VPVALTAVLNVKSPLAKIEEPLMLLMFIPETKVACLASRPVFKRLTVGYLVVEVSIVVFSLLDVFSIPLSVMKFAGVTVVQSPKPSPIIKEEAGVKPAIVVNLELAFCLEAIVAPPSLISFPVTPSKTAMLLLVDEAGPETSPLLVPSSPIYLVHKPVKSPTAGLGISVSVESTAIYFKEAEGVKLKFVPSVSEA